MTECIPTIGIILSDGSVTSIGYAPILSGPIPAFESMLGLLKMLLAFEEFETGDFSTSTWTCDNPPVVSTLVDSWPPATIYPSEIKTSEGDDPVVKDNLLWGLLDRVSGKKLTWDQRVEFLRSAKIAGLEER